MRAKTSCKSGRTGKTLLVQPIPFRDRGDISLAMVSLLAQVAAQQGNATRASLCLLLALRVSLFSLDKMWGARSCSPPTAALPER